MALTPEQINVIRAKSGLPPLSAKNAVAPVQQNTVGKYDYLKPKAKEKGILTRIGEDVKKRGGDIVQTMKDTASGKIHPLETGIQTIGAVAGGVGDIVGEGLKSEIGAVSKAYQGMPDVVKQNMSPALSVIPGINTVINTLKSPIGQAGLEAIKGGADIYKGWAEENPRAAKDLESVVNIASLMPIGKEAEVVGKGAMESIETGIKTIGKEGGGAVGNITKFIGEKIPQHAEKAAQLLASEPNQQVKTILKETPTSNLDEFIKIAEVASKDPRAQSVFEKVGERISEATKQIKKQADSLGQQKSIIINKAKVGLQPFVDAPRKAILKVAQLEDSPIKAQIIEKLKGIKTKLDADKVIDEIQGMIYDAKGTKLIAEGGTVEKQLKGILGEMNTKLKEGLPKAYQTLNAKYADRIKVVKTLNRALGEVVEGVPTRGASLIKQFFSPAGTKTKELFDFIKTTTGIDLAQDSTLAKFTGELFNDPKVRSLLEGIPTSPRGIIEKAVQFGVEKTGLGEGIQNTIRKGTIEKARGITKPSSFNPPAVGETAPTKIGQLKITDIQKFERAKDLDPVSRGIEETAYKKIIKNEEKMLAQNKTKNGKIVNTDDFRPYFKDVGYAGHNPQAVQEPSSYLAKRAFSDGLKNEGKYATIYAGGSGSGKTSALKNIKSATKIIDNSSVVLDGNLSSYSSAIKKIQEAVKAGKKTPIIYVYREPVDSVLNGVVKRMLTNPDEMGRLVPSKVVAENHIGSWDVVKRLKNEGFDVRFIDNSLGAGNAKKTTFEELSKKIKYPSVNELTDKFNKEIKKLYETGTINKSQYQGYTS